MRGFRFRLESVLRLREHRLDQARLALARAQQQQRSAEALAGRLRSRFEAAGTDLERRMGAGLSAGELRDRRRGLSGLASECRRAAHAADEARAAVDRERTRTLAARREVRALERLREKDQAAWRREMARRQQAELDEVGGRRHAEAYAEGGRAR